MPETILVGVLGTGALFENKSIKEIEEGDINDSTPSRYYKHEK